jgi:hypothetical protein
MMLFNNSSAIEFPQFVHFKQFIVMDFYAKCKSALSAPLAVASKRCAGEADRRAPFRGRSAVFCIGNEAGYNERDRKLKTGAFGIGRNGEKQFYCGY